MAAGYRVSVRCKTFSENELRFQAWRITRFRFSPRGGATLYFWDGFGAVFQSVREHRAGRRCRRIAFGIWGGGLIERNFAEVEG
jgi:hypothetical protein